MKKILFLLFIFAAPTWAIAQSFDKNDIESYKIAWITQKLDLSTEDAKIFWPLYNQYTHEQQALRKDRMNKTISMRKITEIDNLSDDEVDAMINSELAFKQREVYIDRKYYQKFKSALPIKTLAKFYRAQETFKKELLDKFRGGPQRRQ